MLGKESVKRIVAPFGNPSGLCFGRKRIVDKDSDTASGAGEGLTGKYESALKMGCGIVFPVGAAGELFAIRTALPGSGKDTLLDDFIISRCVAQDGYTIQYDPEAYAIESAPANVKKN